MPKDDRGLTPKQARFVDEYLIDLNATQAAKRAGYSEKTAQEQSARLLSNAIVSRAIAERRQALHDKLELDQEWVLRNLEEIAGRCMQKKPVMVYDREERGMVQAQDVDGCDIWTFDSAGANRAVELIGKHLRMFTDRLEHTGADAGPIQFIEIVKPDGTV